MVFTSVCLVCSGKFGNPWFFSLVPALFIIQLRKLCPLFSHLLKRVFLNSLITLSCFVMASKTRLTAEERAFIRFLGLNNTRGIRAISRMVGKAPSTILRVLRE